MSIWYQIVIGRYLYIHTYILLHMNISYHVLQYLTVRVYVYRYMLLCLTMLLYRGCAVRPLNVPKWPEERAGLCVGDRLYSCYFYHGYC